MNRLHLKNNIQFISQEVQHLHSVNVSLFFRAGQLYEDKNVYGITHLAEHMFFRRLYDIDQEELYYQMESIGATLRGTTYREFVCFDITVSPKYFSQALTLIFKILQKYNWTAEDLEKEKQVVINQIRFTQNSYINNIDRLYFNMPQFQCGISGTIDTVNNITVYDINKWKEKYFNCDNCCCVISGAVNDNKIKNAVKLLEQIDNTGILQDSISVIPKDYMKRNTKSDIIIKSNYDTSNITIAFDLKDISSKEACYANFLSSILGDGDGSALSLRLKDKEFLSDDMASRVDILYGSRRILIECSCENIKISQTISAIFDEIKKIKKYISEKQYKSNIVFFTENQKYIWDDPRDLSFMIGYYNFILNSGWDVDSTIKNYNEITIPKLIENANKIFAPENLTIITENNNKLFKTYHLKKLLADIRNLL